MGYRVDRIGTPHVISFPVQTSFNLGTLYTAGQTDFFTENRVIAPNPIVQTQYGAQRWVTTASGAFASAKRLAMVQCFSLPEVSEGNSCLVELSVSVKIRAPIGTEIKHEVHALANAPVDGTTPITTLNGTAHTLKTSGANNQATTQVLTFVSKEIVQLVGDDISERVYAHGITLQDSVVEGSGVSMDDMRANLWFRSINHADVLRGYDPVR